MNFDATKRMMLAKWPLLMALLLVIGVAVTGWIVASGKAEPEVAKQRGHAEDQGQPDKKPHDEQAKDKHSDDEGHAEEKEAKESRVTMTDAQLKQSGVEIATAGPARIVLPNPDGVWRPGLPVNIDLIAGEVDVPVAIAIEAVQTMLEKPTVFVREGDQFEPRPVELGRSDDKWSEVIAGIKAGEQYAAKNSFILKAEVGKGEASHDH